MKVTDTRKSDDDIVTTISDRQQAQRRGDRAGCKAQDKSGVRKVGLLLLPSLFLASMIFFMPQKVEAKGEEL